MVHLALALVPALTVPPGHTLYTIFFPPRTQVASKAACIADGGFLAEFEDQVSLGQLAEACGAGKCWIGLNDISVEG